MRLLLLNILFINLIYVPNLCLAEECNLNDFKQYANELDKTKLSSVKSLASVLNRMVEGKSNKCISSFLGEFKHFYDQSLHAYQRKEKIGDIVFPNEAKEKLLRPKLSTVGWNLLMSEGTYYIGETGTWIQQQFGPILPPDWKTYFDQRALEIKEKFAEDAGLLISWENLRKRISFWESFLGKYPNFPLSNEINRYISIYIRTFLTGMDNSPITRDFTSNMLRKDIRDSFENFLKENRNSRYYSIVKKYYNILNKNSFIVTDDLKKYLNSVNF